jgi:hypothetical protein
MVVAVRPLATPLKVAPPRNFAAENGTYRPNSGSTV